MQVATSRFGPVEIEAGATIHFRAGRPGLEGCRGWVLLACRRDEPPAWLQNIERPDVALPVVSPMRLVPGCQVEVVRRELAPLRLDEPKGVKVLAILGKTDNAVTLSLKAPLLINLRRRPGRQVVANGDLPTRFQLGSTNEANRRSA
jgi:flagellar assembly factor FliW